MPQRLPRRAFFQALAVALPAVSISAAQDAPKSALNLKSRAAEAKPITPGERKLRIEQAQRLILAPGEEVRVRIAGK